MAQIFFILGQGGVATGSLAQRLARHSRVAIAPESLFVLDLQRKYGRGGWNGRRIHAFCRDLGRLACMSAWRLDPQRLTLRLQERQSRLSYSEVCRQVYASYAQDSLGRVATRWVGEQNPLYALQIEQIERVLPEARYLHVTRDYRDEIHGRLQCAARPAPVQADGAGQRASGLAWPSRQVGRLWSWLARQASWDHPASIAQRWKEYNQRILELGRHAPERSLWLRHEDLLAYPEHELRRICRFLELDFEPQLLAEPLADLGSQSPAGTREAGHASPGAARWQQLPEPTLRQVEAICGEFAERFGYRSSTRGGGGLSLPARLLTWYGSCSVVAERLAVRVLPPGLRKHAGTARGRIEDSLQGPDLSSEASP